MVSKNINFLKQGEMVKWHKFSIPIACSLSKIQLHYLGRAKQLNMKALSMDLLGMNKRDIQSVHRDSSNLLMKAWRPTSKALF